jgi:Xaa-Pro aminopeptidase
MTEKLKNLRELLNKQDLDAWLQPVHDEWFGEYPPACNRRVEWISGFSGSAGLAIIGREQAVLLTDGRYTLQARAQVPAQFEVQNSGDISAQKWLADNFTNGARVGYDPKLYTRAMLDKLAGGKIELVASENLIDKLWSDRPPAPATKVFEHELKYSGESADSKKKRIAEIIKKSGADAAFISAPESVCWLLNIRARDTENTPLHLARAIVDESGNVEFFEDDAKKFAGKKILFDQQNTSVFITDLLEKAGVISQSGEDPCTLPKAIKNDVEIAGIRKAHIRDGAAVTKLLYWLAQQKNVSELEVVDKILEFRKSQENFLEPSFDTIAGSGANGAIVHYRATAETNRKLQTNELFLLDSGGQYLDGTTDITRTVAIGAPSAEHKKMFTLVLKGHIALATAIFPEGTRGSQLDALARQYLWHAGADYDHGTGHGVGCFLGVHEGPQRVSKRAGDAALMAGMVLSNEPGYYKAGEYGIRIENLVAVVPAGEKFLKFETLTCAPIDKNLVDFSLLTEAEKTWLTDYHKWVAETLKPFLSEAEYSWLIG